MYKDNQYSYSDLVQYARTIYNNFNGKINPLFPARYLLFDLNNDKNTLGKSVGDIIIIYVHNILRLINNYYNEKEEFSIKRAKGIIVFVIVHELFHLNQDYNKYVDKFKKQDRLQIIENSCNAMAVNFIEHFKKFQVYKNIFDLDIDLVTDIIGGYKDKEYYIKNFYEIKSPVSKIVYTLNDLIFNNEDDLLLFIKKKKLNFIHFAYSINNELQKGDLIYFNNHFIDHKLIFNIINEILLILTSSNHQFKIYGYNINENNNNIIDIVINIIDYKHLHIVNSIY